MRLYVCTRVCVVLGAYLCAYDHLFHLRFFLYSHLAVPDFAVQTQLNACRGVEILFVRLVLSRTAAVNFPMSIAMTFSVLADTSARRWHPLCSHSSATRTFVDGRIRCSLLKSTRLTRISGLFLNCVSSLYFLTSRFWLRVANLVFSTFRPNFRISHGISGLVCLDSVFLSFDFGLECRTFCFWP